MKINNEIDGGKEIVRSFVRSLLERNRVSEDKLEEEQARLEELIADRILTEALSALPDEDLDEIEQEIEKVGDLSIDKWNSLMFMEGIRPESVVGKVFREVEREYLGAENVESEETLMKEAEEEE